jgi:hypothetical protein
MMHYSINVYSLESRKRITASIQVVERPTNTETVWFWP